MMKVKYLLILIFMFLYGVSIVSAAQPSVSEVSMVARGSAVVIKDRATARQEAIADTLNNALDRYIHEKMVSGHEYDELINEQMLNHQDRYILSYEIISDRLLGDLLQLELSVNFNKSLLQKDLAAILKPEKRAVQDIRLIITQENINDQLLYEPLLTQPVLLQPEELAKRLNDELTAYGFNLTLQQNIADNLKELLFASIHPDNASAVDMNQFQYLLPGDLTIYIEVKNFHEEKIYTVHKQLLTIEDTLAFIDLKNRTFVTLPAIISKSLTDDLPSGINILSAKLVKKLKNRIMDYMLQKYAVFPEYEEEVTVTINGFHRHQDYIYFREALENLRTIKSVDLNALSSGRIELKVTTYAQIDLLLDWINRFTPSGHNYQLQAGLSNGTAGTILVKIEYAEAAN
ncbi:MAG: hypothetical protein U9P37_06740 [Pseudomonadota bacterium]|nr:hypothetical protein [Pseudomonadota bacterium]